jgi:hypothetical protein
MRKARLFFSMFSYALRAFRDGNEAKAKEVALAAFAANSSCGSINDISLPDSQNFRS